MAEQDTARAVSAEENARIGATPATFANKLYIMPMEGGAKITFAETQRVAGREEVWPRVAVFLQRVDLAALQPCTGCSTPRSTPPLPCSTAPDRRRAVRTHGGCPDTDNALLGGHSLYVWSARPIPRYGGTASRWNETIPPVALAKGA